MHLSLLSGHFLVLIVNLHEVFVTHRLDLLISFLNHITHTVKAELSSFLAFTARITFLVEFCALALEAGNVVSETFSCGSTLFARLTFLVDLGSLTLGAFSYTLHALFLFGWLF